MKLTVHPIPYKVECKTIEDAMQRYKHLKIIAHREVTKHYNMLLMKDNEFAVVTQTKYYILTVKY
jgi:hypothetical protein